MACLSVILELSTCSILYEGQRLDYTPLPSIFDHKWLNCQVLPLHHPHLSTVTQVIHTLVTPLPHPHTPAYTPQHIPYAHTSKPIFIPTMSHYTVCLPIMYYLPIASIPIICYTVYKGELIIEQTRHIRNVIKVINQEIDGYIENSNTRAPQ